MTSLLVLLAALCAQDPSVDEIVDRMQELSDSTGVKKLAWRVFAKYGPRYYTQDMGLELLGRFNADEGIRTMVTTLGCADATEKRPQPGPNHYVVVHTRDAVTIAPIMLLIEARISPTAKLDSSFPYMIFRSRIGEPGHDEIEPMLVPASLDNLLFVNEPIIQFQLAPKVMFAHEPNKKMIGRRPWLEAGKAYDCLVIETTRNPASSKLDIPRDWSRLANEVKRFYIDPSNWHIRGMEFELTRWISATEAPVDKFFIRVERRWSQQEAPPAFAAKLDLPLDLVMMPSEKERQNPGAVLYRTIEWQNKCFD